MVSVAEPLPTIVPMSHTITGKGTMTDGIGSTLPIATEAEPVMTAMLILVIEDITVEGVLPTDLTTVAEMMFIIPPVMKNTTLGALVTQPATGQGGPMAAEVVTGVTGEMTGQAMIRMKMII